MSLWLSAVVVLGALFVAGNVAILVAHLALRHRAAPPPAGWAAGTHNAHEVSELVWRSGRPTREMYEAIAAAGASLVVDLRAEGGDGPPEQTGLAYVRLPIRDGQPPTPEQIDQLLDALRAAAGPTLVHCSAGVGRTGSMVAAWLTIDGGRSARTALRHALAVGPPSLEQIDFILGLPERRRPRSVAIAVSRVLDAPRRIWSRIRQAFRH